MMHSPAQKHKLSIKIIKHSPTTAQKLEIEDIMSQKQCAHAKAKVILIYCWN